MLERRWLLGVARQEREGLGRTIQYTPPDRWEADSPCEGWRVKDVLAHLAASEVAAAAIIGDEPATELDEHRKSLQGRPFTADGWNEWAVARRRDLSRIELAAEWGRAADLFLARASKITEDDWVGKELPWTVDDVRIGYLVQMRVAEWWVHGEDLLEGGGQPPRLEHNPIFCVNDLAIRLLPYAFALDGRSFPGASVRVQLEGVGEGDWHQGLEAGFVPPPDKRPDAVVIGRGYAFASVAGHRADPDVCLYEGLLGLGGDVEIAEAVLTSLRSFP
ncbi:MAG TPA: maleylpyruvate isomerase family mycothiol-dependent enzyme [Actinomycetota bacterium]|nr:maleylpyruvate isomerase family mycothiol-dependent enzyme [Actinomycetota bacterium]